MEYTKNTETINKDLAKFKYNRFNPSVNEWINSIYTFQPGWDKKNYNLINNKLSHNLIDSYFNMKFYIKKKTIYRLRGKKKLVNWLNYLSLNRIFVGIPEFKHNIQNLNILIYIFNKEETLLLKKIKALASQKQSAGHKFKISNQPFPVFYSSCLINSDKVLTRSAFDRGENLNKNLNFYLKPIFCNINSNLKFKCLKLFLYKLYLVKLYFNKYKFNYNNLFFLNQILSNIYRNNVPSGSQIKMKIIKLKYLHLDNSIFIEAITRKLKDRNKKVLRVLRNALILPKIPTINNLLLINKNILIKLFQNMTKQVREGMYLINGNRYRDLKSFKCNQKSVLYTMKNTHIVGVRLEGSGRLTRRLTASRAVNKIAYIGSLKNIFSSYQGLSSVINKGFEKSSINYINQNSNNRNGAFGIKSWQNTM